MVHPFSYYVIQLKWKLIFAPGLPVQVNYGAASCFESWRLGQPGHLTGIVFVAWEMAVAEKTPNCFVLVVMQGMNGTRGPTRVMVRPSCQMCNGLEAILEVRHVWSRVRHKKGGENYLELEYWPNLQLSSHSTSFQIFYDLIYILHRVNKALFIYL